MVMHHTSAQDQFDAMVLLWQVVPTPFVPVTFPGIQRTTVAKGSSTLLYT